MPRAGTGCERDIPRGGVVHSFWRFGKEAGTSYRNADGGYTHPEKEIGAQKECATDGGEFTQQL